MMKILNTAWVWLLVIVALMLCWYMTGGLSSSIPILVKNDVILATGINFENNNLVAINPFTSEQITPCNTNKAIENVVIADNPNELKKDQIQNKLTNRVALHDKGCNVKIEAFENPILNAAFRKALELSKAPIIGTVKVNGEDKGREARILVTVTALYQGSHCSYTTSNGVEYKSCVSKEEHCLMLKKHKLPCPK
jgi:hypothetical protein